MIDASKQFPEMVKRCEEAVVKAFPIASTNHVLSASNFRWEDLGDDVTNNIALHKEYKTKDKTLTAKLIADLEIREKGGRSIDKMKHFVLLTLPHVTCRSSYIVNGHEVQTVNQLRLRPGPYTRYTASNDTETFINAAGGGYKIVFERETGRLRLKSGTSHVDIYPILAGLGITDKAMLDAWGGEVFEANKKYDDPKALEKLYHTMRRFSEPVTDSAQLKTAVDTYFRSKAIDPRISKITLGKEYKAIEPGLLFDAASKAVALANGFAKADDTESLAFKSIHSVEDFVPEKIAKAVPFITREIAYKMDRDPKITSLISPATFSGTVLSWFETSEFTRYSEQNNPVDMAGTVNLTTTMGEGGIQSTHAVKDEVRLVHPSHMGFLDPCHSPEGSRIGITGHLALGAEKRGNDLVIRVTDAKTGETVHKTPQELELAVIAFNDQYDLTKAKPKPVSPMVKAKNGSKIEIVPAASVQYIFRDPKGFFSIVTNAIPFLHNNSPNRVLMADRHIEQSVPLKDPDMPLVQSRYAGELGYHDFFGRSFNARSPDDGVITKITKDEIKVKVGGEVKTVYLHNNYPLNGDAFLHDTPIVKVGDKVKKGQVLADNNFSKNGTLTFSKRLTSVSGDTHVLWFDEKGGHFTPIQDAPARAGVRSLAMCSDGKIVTSPIKAFIGHYTDRGMYKIITDTGTIVKATESHSFVTAGEDGHLIKVKPEEMKEGITLLPQAHSFELPEDIEWAEGHAKRGAASIRLRLDRDAGFLFGIYVAEGSGRRAIMMAATEPEIREKLVAIAKKWGLGYKETPTMIVIYSAALRNLLHEKCGYLSQHKRIPDLLWSAPREFKIGFIDGYWSGDGSANKGNVSAATASYILAVGLRMLLAHLGVRTHLGMEPAKGTHMASWHIRAYQETLGNFPELSLLRKHKGVVRLASLPMSLSRDRIPITHQQRLLIDKILGKQIRNDVGYVTRPMIKGIIEKLPEEIQRLYKAPVWWDVAVSVVPTDFEDYVYDLDMAPVSTFLVESGLAVHNTAYMPYKGMNFEDGIVISEGAAKKLTSSHKYDLRLDKTATMKTGLKIWLAHYPDRADIIKPDKYDADGIVKKGAILAKGDPVIPAVEQAQIDEEMAYARLHKSLRTPFRDVSIYWEENYPGEVIDVVKTGKFVRVFVKTDEALQIGDKLSQSSGGKGIVVALIPDNEMYRDEKGNVIDVLFNPASVGGRVNPGQFFEGAAGKISEKTGKKYLVDNFSSESSLKKLQNDLKANGLKDTENVFDPVGNRTIENVFVGQVPFFKLKHQVRHKFSAKGIGPYTGEQQPAKVSGESAQNIGTGELYALLGGGSTHFLKDVSTLKSQSNPEYWRAYQLGLPTPPPKSPYILDKFMTYLEGAGINLVQDGSQFKVLPLTDKAVLAKSHGEIKNPSVVRASDLRPEAGGLFDREITGGFGGVNWNHIVLESPIPNPLMERPIVSVTKITSSQFKQIMEGLLFVKPDGSMTTDHTQGKAAGEGIKYLLDRIDIDKELKDLVPAIRTARASQLDDMNRRRRYLQSLKLSGLKPSQAYIQSVVPVIPPVFRQIYPLPDGALNVADPNHCYREILLVNNQLKDLKAKGVDSKNLANLRSSLYGAVQGMAGVAEPLTRGKNFQGFISTIKGRINKYGLFQGRVVKRPQDLSGRSTIIPNPKYGIDDVGIPEDMGLVIYKPFIMRRLVVSGIPPMQASELIEKKDERALAALRAEIKERPVYLNRAPTLHKFGILALKPTLVKGQAIQINPLIVKGFNMDFDGDQQYIHVVAFLSESAILKAKELFGNSFVEDHRMAARFNLTIPSVKDGDVFMFHLEDFPVGEKIKVTEGEKGPIEWYAAIPGTKVAAYDEKTGKAVWAAVTLWSKHLDRLVETVELESGRQLFVDDDPRAVYGLEAGSLGFVRHSPADAVRTKMWVPRVSEIEEAPGGRTWTPVFEDGGRLHLNSSIDLDFDFGYLVGAAAGDGWGVHSHETTRGVSISYGEGGEPVVDRCDTIISRMFSGIAPEKSLHDSGGYGTSWVATWSSVELGSLIGGLTGRGAENKHLPPFFMSAPLAFRKGLFAGLMDTDGSISISRAKKKPQLMSNASSKSLRLLQEAGLLAASFGIASRITPTKTPAGLPFWSLGFCGPDIKRWGGEGMAHPGKLKALAEAKDIDDSRPAPRADIIPITESLASFIREEIPAPRNATKKQKSLYTIFSSARNRLSVARAIVDDLLKVVPRNKILEHPKGLVWLTLVENRKVKWDRVTGFTKTGIRKTGYDLTVPGYETFMSADGVILSNTVGIHVPVSEDARKEAFNKMPSTHLLAVTDFSAMHAPSKEYALGLYLMTEPKGIPVQAKATGEVVSMYEAGKIKINTPVVIGGKIWTAGQVIINDLFPSDLKPGNVTITRKVMEDFLANLARKHPKEAGAVITSLKDWGAKAVTEIGFSVGLKDLETDYKARDLILSDAAKAAKTVGFDKAYLDATTKMNDLVKNSKENRFVIGNITSGAFGKGSQITQMIATPVAMVDHKGEVIKVPITKSYAEGHDIASYWATIPGSRKGLMDKGLGTQDVGTLSKRLVNTTIEQIISTMDCGTEQGIPMPPDSRDALDRVIARGPYKGQVVTPEFAGKLKSKGVPEIVVRSPLRCSAIRGICAKCYGLAENGQFLPVGFHVGALVGQSVSEPVLQTMLRGFHTGGAISKSRVGFDRIEEIFEMPENVVGKASLAMQGGTVTNVKPGLGGGWNVTIGTMDHFVPKELGLSVKKGDKIAAGQKISETGAIKPQELLEATGDIHRVRDQIIADLQKEYSSGGINMRRKLFETAVKPMTDRAEVIDAGGANRLGIYRGDIVSINKIEDVNAKLPQKEKIQYRATLLPIRVSPFKGEDFIGKLMFERPHETLKEAPAIGAIADLAKGHPVTRFVFGSFKKA